MTLTDHLTLNIINDVSTLNSIYREWLELYNRSKNAAPFLSPDWQIPWWIQFGDNNMLNVIEIRFKNHLCGVAPVFTNYLSEAGTKEYKFIGTGNSDYLDVILDDELTEPCMQLIYRYISENIRDREHCFFQGLQFNSPFFSIQPPNDLKVEVVKENICPVILLPQRNRSESILNISRAGNTLDKLLSKKFNKYIKRNKRILGESGLLELVTAGLKNINLFLDELFTIHRDRWNLKEQPGVLNETNVQSFHKLAAVNLLEHGSLKIYKLLHNNSVIAIIYILIKDRTIYNYLGGFNPEYKKFSPGSILLYEVIKECTEAGFNEFNMLNGEEDYKYRWGAVDKMNYTIIIKHK